MSRFGAAVRSCRGMDPVRLALDVGPLHGHRTGVGAAVAALAEALDDHSGVDVVPYLLSFRTRPQPPVRRLPLPAAVAQRLWSRADWPPMDRWLGATQVIHGTNYVVPPSRHPRVVSVYDTWFLANPDRATATVRRAGEVLRRSVRAGAVVHTSSTATADSVRTLLGTERVEVIHLAPLPVPPDPGNEHGWATTGLGLCGTPFILALGTLERRKNVPQLVAAFARAELGDAQLVLAGADGDDAAAVEEAVIAQPASVQRRVRRLGPVDDRTKGWLLHHAAVLAYPSLDEGFGFPILEAQSVGLPVVATAVGSIPEVGGGGVELVPPQDLDALAAGLARAINDDARRRELVAAGTKNLERFSWASTADALVRLYRRMVAAEA